LNATGRLHWAQRDFKVNGLAWMDHEFFSESPGTDLAGWDWFAIQLDDRQELMLYRLRSKSGNDRYSSGTFVDANGKSHYLNNAQFAIQPGATWHSADSGATYPVSWTITVPSLGIELTEKTALRNQELFDANGTAPTYWEGAVTYEGAQRGSAVHGVGYLEMTGYAGPMRGLGSP
jgi:predicted secreted hydrolase